MAAEALGSPEGWPPRRYGGTVADCVPHRRGEVKKNGKAPIRSFRLFWPVCFPQSRILCGGTLICQEMWVSNPAWLLGRNGI